jgi:hypothetical protein
MTRSTLATLGALQFTRGMTLRGYVVRSGD